MCLNCRNEEMLLGYLLHFISGNELVSSGAGLHQPLVCLIMQQSAERCMWHMMIKE